MLALVLGTLQVFLSACPSAAADPEPRNLALCPCKALEKPVPSPQDRKTCTARITYCRQMGHSFMRLPHLVQVTMWPHSSRTQSMGESMQILHRFSSWLGGTAPPEQTQGGRGHSECVEVGEHGHTMNKPLRPHTSPRPGPQGNAPPVTSSVALSRLHRPGFRFEEQSICRSNAPPEHEN